MEMETLLLIYFMGYIRLHKGGSQGQCYSVNKDDERAKRPDRPRL